MAGFKGMGTPSALKPVVPEADPVTVPDLAMKGVGQPAPMPISEPQREMASAIDFDAIQAEAEGTIVAQDAIIDFDAIQSEAETNPGEENIEEKSFLENYTGVAKDIFMNATLPGQVYSRLTGRENEVLNSETAQHLGARARHSFAVTDAQKEDIIKKSFGQENVRKSKGTSEGFDVRINGKWREFDPSSFEPIADTLDWTREAIEGAATEGATVAGLAAGAALAPATGGVSALAVPAAARGAGAALGLWGTNKIGELLGVAEDEKRSTKTEYAIAIGANVLLGKMGDILASRGVKKAEEAAANRLKTIAERSADDIAEVKTLSNDLVNEGILVREDGNSPLTIDLMLRGEPNAKAMVEKVASTPQYHEIHDGIQNSFVKGTMNWIRNLADTPGNKVYNLGNDVANELKAAREAEGNFIGSIRAQAIEAAGKSELPVPELSNRLNTMMNKLGFIDNPAEGIFRRPSVDDYVATGIPEKQANALFGILEDLHGSLVNNNGRMNMSEIIGNYQRYTSMVNRVVDNHNIPFSYKNNLIELKNMFRDELTSKIDVILPNSGYQNSLKKFSEKTAALDELGSFVDKSLISTDAMVDGLFGSKADARSRIKAFKTFAADRPELFEKIKGAWIERAIVKSNNDPGKIAKILGADPEVAADVFGPQAGKVIGQIGEMSEILKGAVPKRPQERMNIFRSAMTTVFSALGYGAGAGTYANSAANFVRASDPKKILQTIISEDGIEKYIRLVPESDRGIVRQIFSSLEDKAISAGTNPASRNILRESMVDSYAREEEEELP